MQKKLMAVAVAGVLGAPAVALAQASTVQVFGTMYWEYSYVDQGRNAAGVDRTNADFIQDPGSEIGFKGEEKLGGGLSAWFQCSSTADFRAQSTEGWCSRNSALGLKGAFGNFFIGNWDTPFKRSISPGQVGGNDTGVWGTAFLLTAGSTTTAVGGTRGAFKRRQNNLVSYDSPNFAGFQVMAAFSSSQPSTATLDNASNNKPRVMSLGGQYSAGPIYAAAGYEIHKEYNGAGRDGDDSGWHVAGAYTWGPVKFGGVYTRQKFETGTTAAPTESRVSAWHLGVDWKIVGPHGLRASYTQARDVKGTGPAIAGSGATRPAPGPDTGAKLWGIRYVYTFSKRTEFNVGYVRLNNDNNATYTLGGLTGGPGVNFPGDNQKAFAAALRHTF
jgi:predicted porin